MDTIFTVRDDEFTEKLNLDDLYEKKQQHDLFILDSYNKILNRIHTRIKTTSRQNINAQHCWYVVPEVMIGIPKFDHGECVAYIINKLSDNGFKVKYTHPNLLLISWQHWIPSYVRNEIKKKTGVAIDGHGNKIENKNNKEKKYNDDNDDPNSILLGKIQKTSNNSNNSNNNNNNDEYKKINTYKPSGNLIYNPDLLDKIGNKLS